MSTKPEHIVMGIAIAIGVVILVLVAVSGLVLAVARYFGIVP